MKILLVEDDSLHSAYLRDVVREAMPEVTEVFCATNGADGEQQARRNDIGAIIMDLQMPARSGIDAARAIWAERPNTRILFWSNYSDEAYLRGISRIVPAASSYGYILKTTTKERLQLALRAVFLGAQIVIDREIHRAQHRQTRTADSLTESEYAVLVDMALGLPDRAIAMRHGLSLRTVQNRLLSLYDKLGVDDGSGAWDGIGVNKRVRAVACALNQRALNAESLLSAERELQGWLHSPKR